MGRVEKKMYRRARGQVVLRRVLVLLTALVVVAGLASRRHAGDAFTAEPVAQPTATPVASAFDETVETREITLEEENWYAIQTGIFSTEEAAMEKADMYAQRGAPGYVSQDGVKWRVMIACYGVKDDASAVRERLSAKQDVETYLHTWNCPKMTLRLTGMAGQLDVVEAGLDMLGQAAVLLRDQAALMDSGEITAGEATQMILGLGEQMSLWYDTAAARFVKPYPALVSQQMTMAENWTQQQLQLTDAAQQGATQLSAEMKLQAMALYDQSVKLRQNLMNE